MWDRTIDNNGNECYVNYEKGIVVYFRKGSKHHYYEDVLIMFDNEVLDRAIKPSMDKHAGSTVEIVKYKDVKAEFGRRLENIAGNTIEGVPEYFKVFGIYHAFCAKIGYYEYAEYPIDTEDGITDNWYETLEFYKNGGYYE